jgi:aromatic-amino-acid transaminase
VLDERVRIFNELAPAYELQYPRYEGGFFVTVFSADPLRAAAAMREEGLFVVPQEGALRVALCAVSKDEIPALVEILGSNNRREAGTARRGWNQDVRIIKATS